jgi:predicted ATPase
MFIRSLSYHPGPESAGYWRSIPAFRALGQLTFSRPVTFFVGENGSGKSTLLEAIAVNYGFNPEGGSRNFRFSTRDSHSELYKELRLVRMGLPNDSFFLRAESFYNVATEVDSLSREGNPQAFLDQYGGKSLHEQSHGESFLSLALHRFRGNGLYILDEPESALSPTGQMSLLCAIHRLAGENSQFIIATHSPILMACPGAAIYQIGQEGLEQVPYQQTQHYQITKSFLNNPQPLLKILLEED